jgi:hypothetical protein
VPLHIRQPLAGCILLSHATRKGLLCLFLRYRGNNPPVKVVAPARGASPTAPFTSYSLLFTLYFLLFTLYLARLSAPSAPDEIFFAKSLVGLKKITLFAKKLLKQIFVTYKIRASDIYT